MPRASQSLKSSLSIAPTMIAVTPDCLAAASQLFSSSLHAHKHIHTSSHTRTRTHTAVSALHGVSDGARKADDIPPGEEALGSAGERAPCVLGRSAAPPYCGIETNCCTAALPLCGNWGARVWAPEGRVGKREEDGGVSHLPTACNTPCRAQPPRHGDGAGGRRAVRGARAASERMREPTTGKPRDDAPGSTRQLLQPLSREVSGG